MKIVLKAPTHLRVRGQELLYILSLTLLLILPSLTHSSPHRSTLLESRIGLFEAWVENVIDEQALVGLSVGLVHNQELIYSKGFGFADLTNRTPANKETTYKIASITKLFTSIALMQLVEEEKLRLDTSVTTLVPELQQIQANEHNVNEITVRSILTHTTGLPTMPNFILDKKAAYKKQDRNSFLAGLHEQELIFPATRIHKYSNLAMNLGGVIIERISGLTYEEYVRKFILEPLEMNSSYFKDESNRSQAIGYSRVVNRQRDSDEFPQMPLLLGIPASGLISNTTDLAKFASWHFRTLAGKDQKVLSTQTLLKMQQVQEVPLPFELPPSIGGVAAFLSNSFEVGGTGLGYFLREQFISHSGGLMGFVSEFVMDNQTKLGVIALANSIDAPVNFSHARSITKNLYDMVGAVALEPPDKKHRFVEYEGIYSDGHNWSQYVVGLEDQLLLLNLRDDKPMDKPAVLNQLEKDTFEDSEHRGFYSGEFSVRFHRDENDEIDALILNQEKLYRKGKK